MSDIFNFILVMVSLVLAIGVTHLVNGVASLIRLRDRVRLEPLTLVWATSLFLVAAIYWWSLWDLRSAQWRFPQFFYLLLAPTLLHVAASLLVSSDPHDIERGASSEFERIRVPFMLVMCAFSVLVMADGWVATRPPAFSSASCLARSGPERAGRRSAGEVGWYVDVVQDARIGDVQPDHRLAKDGQAVLERGRRRECQQAIAERPRNRNRMSAPAQVHRHHHRPRGDGAGDDGRDRFGRHERHVGRQHQHDPTSGGGQPGLNRREHPALRLGVDDRRDARISQQRHA